MTPKEFTAWIAAITPVLGLLGWQGYEQAKEVGSSYVTHEQSAAEHLDLRIYQIETELRYMDDRDLNDKELIYYEQLMRLRGDLDADRVKYLGIVPRD